MDISIGRLHQLIMVARTRSFSKAAVELNISQPALSRSIGAIEARYGFQIFNRVGNGVQLTAAGSQVIAQAEPLLQTMRVFDENLRLFGSGQAGKLKFGLTPLLASEMLAGFASDFFRPERAAELQVMVRPGSALLEALRNDLVEFIFFPESHIQPAPDIVIKPIGAIAPACVVRRDHPLAHHEAVYLKDVLAFPWGSSIEGRQPLEVLNPARFICDNYHILREAVLSTDLICLCSAAFISRDLQLGRLHELRIEDLPLARATICTAELPGRIQSPLAVEAVKWITTYIETDAARIGKFGNVG